MRLASFRAVVGLSTTEMPSRAQNLSFSEPYSTQREELSRSKSVRVVFCLLVNHGCRVTQLMQVRTKKLLQLVNAEGRLAVHCLPPGSPPLFINLCFRLLSLVFIIGNSFSVHAGLVIHDLTGFSVWQKASRFATKS